MSERGAWLLCVAATFGFACDGAPSPQLRPQGILSGEEVAKGPVNLPQSAREPKNAPPPPSSLPSPFVKSAPNPGALTNPDAGAASGTDDTAATAAPSDAGPKRDLSRELSALLGQPASCLDLAAVEKAGGRATVTATANVMPSGRITRASVQAPGQPSSAVKCLEQRVSSGSLKGPIAGAPLEVHTSVPVEVVASSR